MILYSTFVICSYIPHILYYIIFQTDRKVGKGKLVFHSPFVLILHLTFSFLLSPPTQQHISLAMFLVWGLIDRKRQRKGKTRTDEEKKEKILLQDKMREEKRKEDKRNNYKRKQKQR